MGRIMSYKAGRRMSKENASNALLFLYLIDKSNEIGRIEGQKKLMKLLFLAENKMIESELKGLNYHFYKYHHGAFSKQVYEDRDLLIENDLLTDEGGFRLTERGKKVISDFEEVLEEKNKIFTDIVEGIVEEYVSYPPWKLEELSNKLEIEGVEIGSLPIGETLLDKLFDHQAREIFDIDDDWIDTLEIYLDYGFDKSLSKALERARKEEARPYQ